LEIKVTASFDVGFGGVTTESITWYPTSFGKLPGNLSTLNWNDEAITYEGFGSSQAGDSQAANAESRTSDRGLVEPYLANAYSIEETPEAYTSETI
jgi:hypothetical protein